MGVNDLPNGLLLCAAYQQCCCNLISLLHTVESFKTKQGVTEIEKNRENKLRSDLFIQKWR